MSFEKGQAARRALEAREAAALQSEEPMSDTPTQETTPAPIQAADPVSAMLLEIQRQNAENQRQSLELQRQQLDFQRQTLDEDRRVRPRENAVDPGISAYSYPEGDVKHPKPKLGRFTETGKFIPRVTYFPPGVKQYEELMPPEEIEAFNAFTHNCSARDGRWTATITQNGTTEILVVDVPCKNPDDRLNLPNGILLILAELRGGPRAVDVGTLAAESAALRAEVEALRRDLAASAAA